MPQAPGDKKRNLFMAHPMFADLDRGELDALLLHTRIQQVSANHIIFRRGDPGDCMMAVTEGRVKISTVSSDGKQTILNIIGPGDVFGEIALFDGKERSADAIAMEKVALIVLDRRDFQPLLRRNPEFSLKMIAFLCEKLRRTTEQVEYLFLGPEARVAKALMTLARSCGRETEQGLVIDAKLSQSELASMVGLTREALNRQLREWRENGTVSLDDRRIVILDVCRLERIAKSVG